MATRVLQIEVLTDASQTSAAFAKLGQQASFLERRFGTAGAAASRVGTQMATLARRAALPAAAGVAFAGKSFIDFNEAMTSSLAIMDDVAPKMRDKMEDAAREVGKTTKFGAEQAAESYFFLASAGLDAAESLKAMPVVSKFAQAGNFDLATATDLATDAQSALGLTVENTTKNIKNLAQTQDVLVKANTLANATVEQFSTALTNKAGAAIKVLNKDMEEGVAVLAAYADQGVKGEEAGTALNIVLRDLQKAAIGNEEAFKDADIAVFDAEGTMRNIGDIVGDLEDRFEGMTDKQRKAELSTLGFQEKSQAFLLTLLGSSDAIREYEGELRKAGGTTERVADKQMEGLTGAVERFKSTIAEAGLEIGERMAPTLEELADTLSDPKLTGEEKFSEALGLISDKLADLAPKAAEAGAKVAGAFAEGLGKAFVQANPLAKLLIGAGLLRLLGGRGAILASGAGVGRFLGIGLATGAGTAAAGGAGAGAAAGGIGGAIGGALKNIRWARVGGIAGGIALAGTVLKGFEDEMRRSSEDLFEGMSANLETIESSLPEKAIESIFGETDQTQLARGLREHLGALEKITDERIRISASVAEEIRGAEDVLTHTNEQREALRNTLKLLEQGRQLDVAVDLGMDEAQLQRIEEGFSFLSTGIGASLGDIEKVTQRTTRIINEQFGPKTAEGRELLARNFSLAASNIATAMEHGEISVKEGRKRIEDLIRNMNLTDPTRKVARDFGREWAKGMGEGKDATRRGIKEMLGEIEKMPRPAQQIAFDTWQGILRESAEKGDLTKEEFRKLRSKALSHLEGIRKKGPREAGVAASQIYNPFRTLTNVTGDALETMGVNVQGLLKKLGVSKDIDWAAKTAPPRLQAQRYSGGFQRGGPVMVPGSGTGDIVDAALPAGSFVLNREASAMLGFQVGGPVPVKVEPGELAFPPDAVAKIGPELAALNAQFPRFQAGGIVGVGKQLQEQGYLVSEHGAFGGIQGGHAPNSFHYSNQALDVNWPGPGEMAKLDALHARLQRMPGVIELLWRVTDHFDHLHVAFAKGASGMVGGIGNLPRTILEGPQGLLRRLGQAALDQTTQAAESFLSGLSFEGAESGVSGGSLGKPQLKNLWTMAGGSPQVSNLAAAISLAESAGRPDAVNHNANGTWDAGLWQINQVHGYPLNQMLKPGPNAGAAVDVWRQAGGFSPWVAYNTGAHTQHLQRGGTVGSAALERLRERLGRQRRQGRELDDALSDADSKAERREVREDRADNRRRTKLLEDLVDAQREAIRTNREVLREVRQANRGGRMERGILRSELRAFLAEELGAEMGADAELEGALASPGGGAVRT